VSSKENHPRAVPVTTRKVQFLSEGKVAIESYIWAHMMDVPTVLYGRACRAISFRESNSKTPKQRNGEIES
jgi:hypothetical protein